MIKGLTLFLLALGGEASYIRPIELACGGCSRGAGCDRDRAGPHPRPRGPAGLARERLNSPEQQQQLENEYTSKKAMLKAEKTMSLRRSTRRSGLDSMKIERHKLRQRTIEGRGGRKTARKPIEATIDEEVAAGDNVKQAAAEAKEAAAAACDDARKKKRGRAAQRRNQRLQRQGRSTGRRQEKAILEAQERV